jgi:hypothetical protein
METSMFRAPSPVDMQLRDHAVNTWLVKVDGTVTAESIASQRFWQNLSTKLKPGDEVTIWCPDNDGIDITVRLLSVDRGAVKHRTLRSFVRDEDPRKVESIPGPEGMFIVKPNGPNGHSIVNRFNLEPVEAGIRLKVDAQAKCDEMNRKAQSAAA